MKFIYVFDTAARDKLLNAGFTLLRSDAKNNTYTFVTDSRMKRFSFDGIDHIESDILSF